MTKICPRKQLPEWKWWELGYAANHLVWRARVGLNATLKEEGSTLYKYSEVHPAGNVSRIMLKDWKEKGEAA